MLLFPMCHEGETTSATSPGIASLWADLVEEEAH